MGGDTVFGCTRHQMATSQVILPTGRTNEWTNRRTDEQTDGRTTGSRELDITVRLWKTFQVWPRIIKVWVKLVEDIYARVV